MKKLLTVIGISVSLVSLTGCWDGGEIKKEPAPSPTEAISTPQVITASPAAVPSIDAQIDELREKNGDVPTQERERLNNVPVIPDVFDK